MTKKSSTLIKIEGKPAEQLEQIKALTKIPLKQLGNIAIAYFGPGLLSGEYRIVNGKLERTDRVAA